MKPFPFWRTNAFTNQYTTYKCLKYPEHSPTNLFNSLLTITYRQLQNGKEFRKTCVVFFEQPKNSEFLKANWIYANLIFVPELTAVVFTVWRSPRVDGHVRVPPERVAARNNWRTADRSPLNIPTYRLKHTHGLTGKSHISLALDLILGKLLQWNYLSSDCS